MLHSYAKKIWMVLVLVVCALLLAVATQYDLVINQRVYSPENGFVVFMEAVGWWPLYLPGLFWGGFLLRRSHQPVWGFLISLGSSIALCLPTFSYLSHRGWLTSVPLWAQAIVVTITFLVSIWFAGIPGRRTSMRLSFICSTGFWMMALVNLVLQGMKLVWNRTRFDDMLASGNFDQFTPWYHPFGNGGSSFPSAHTAAAAGVLLLLLAADIFPMIRRHVGFWGVVCTLYIGCMAACRVVIGRHFLSDTVVASLIVWGLFAAVQHSSFWKSCLKQLQDRLTAL